MASCLPPLVVSIKDEVPELIAKLLLLLLSSDNFGERKGAAYGLAGLVKGSGILALKQLEIMTALTNAVQNKKNAKEREGMRSILCTYIFLAEQYLHIIITNESRLLFW